MRPLKSIQARVHCMILREVQYPGFLHGGIRGRDYVTGASVHRGVKILVAEDIESFFDSVTTDLVFDIWHHFFRFPPSISACLTKLTTKDGHLPQGAKTSSLLANLVFWREETGLVTRLGEWGVRYTRLIDDIVCSSRRVVTKDTLRQIIGAIYAMCTKKGLHVKRRKHRIDTAGERITTTNLIVNTRVSLPKEERSAIRSLVHGFCKEVEESSQGSSVRLMHSFNRVSGKVGKLKRFHANEAAPLRNQLRHAREKLESGSWRTTENADTRSDIRH
jgi:hypothetical protein